MINSTIALIFSYITSIQMQNSIQLNCWFIISVMWINLRCIRTLRCITFSQITNMTIGRKDRAGLRQSQEIYKKVDYY